MISKAPHWGASWYFRYPNAIYIGKWQSCNHKPSLPRTLFIAELHLGDQKIRKILTPRGGINKMRLTTKRLKPRTKLKDWDWDIKTPHRQNKKASSNLPHRQNKRKVVTLSGMFRVIRRILRNAQICGARINFALRNGNDVCAQVDLVENHPTIACQVNIRARGYFKPFQINPILPQGAKTKHKLIIAQKRACDGLRRAVNSAEISAGGIPRTITLIDYMGFSLIAMDMQSSEC